MKSAQKQYTDEVRKRFGGYYATWTPDVPLKLGDVGILENNIFKRMDNLNNLGLTFEIIEDQTKASLEYSSKNSVKLTNKIAGDAVPQGSMLKISDTGIIVEFSREKAVLFKLNNVTSSYIDKLSALGDDILDRYNNNQWKKEWVVITELKKAESATIIISNSKDSKIELKANANIGITDLDIANTSFNFSVQNPNNADMKIIAQEGLTPLFQLMGITKKGSSTEITILNQDYSFELITGEDFSGTE
jgi:hypothetical protein